MRKYPGVSKKVYPSGKVVYYGAKWIAQHLYRRENRKLIDEQGGGEIPDFKVYKADDVADLAERGQDIISRLLQTLIQCVGPMPEPHANDIKQYLAELEEIAGK